MELSVWKTGVEKHVPALEVFMKNVLLRKCKVELLDSSTGSNEDGAEAMEGSVVIVRAVEENFETEIFLGFSEAWIAPMGKVILDVDDSQNDEITKDLFREFATHLLEVIKGSFGEIGIELKFTEVEHIKLGQLNRSFNLQKYMTATLGIEQKFDMGDGDEQGLKLSVAMAHPNKDKFEMFEVEFSDENPFLSGDYQAISSRYAGYVELDRISESRDAISQGGTGSSVNVKGKQVEFENFDKASAVKNHREVRNIGILKNVEMRLSVELGRREMPLGEILKLVKGSVIELEKLAGEPVEILVNGHTIAQGDVVVIDEHFGVRISNLIATQEHLRELN